MINNKLLKRIKADRVQAIKNKDKDLKDILTCLVGEIEMVGKNNGNRETTEEETLKVVTKFKKGVNDTIEILKKDPVNDVKIEELLNEIDVYDEYLPQLMSEEEIRKIALDLIDEIGFLKGGINMGMIMKSFKTLYPNQYDGKTLSKIVKEIL